MLRSICKVDRRIANRRSQFDQSISVILILIGSNSNLEFAIFNFQCGGLMQLSRRIQFRATSRPSDRIVPRRVVENFNFSLIEDHLRGNRESRLSWEFQVSVTRVNVHFYMIFQSVLASVSAQETWNFPLVFQSLVTRNRLDRWSIPDVGTPVIWIIFI